MTGRDPVGDGALMARAVALAERGRGTTGPNPLVGCVITRNGAIVGEGWHERAGGPHAEVVALEDAGDRAVGATVFVTLEPCDHHGRTPPCTRALREARVSRVVYGLADPNPEASGGGATLRDAGIQVEGGVLGGFVRAQNRSFLVNVVSGRPALTLKLAQTLEGQLDAPAGRWITGTAARRHVHRLRARADAVLVGVGTILADDPWLDVRHVPAAAGQPRTVVVDSRGRTPAGARVVRPGTIVLTTAAADPRWRDALVRAGVDVVTAPGRADGRVELLIGARELLERGVRRVLAEPGPTLSGALVSARLVDRLVLHVAGREGNVDPAPCTRRPDGARWRPLVHRPLGDDRELVLAPEEEP